ncbi:MAG: pyridoxamine 5'-phosphate oxidase family protein [Patescibacteria group bacterium]
MNNNDTEIEKVIRQYISPLLHLSLATVQNNTPWVCELHFAYDDDLNLYFRSRKSRRHSQELVSNPNVAGNIMKEHGPNDDATGVYFEGTAKLLEPGDEQNVAFQCIKDRLQANDSILEEAQGEDGHQFYKITVSNWYFFGLIGETYDKHKLDKE